ncbi:Fe(3+)-hydroxamate ABC transporter permease FhuB [Paracoccus aminophilus]|uniref:ABC cobalamin/Fe3+-siderophore transporter, inner membrane subunit n=1 Tax=Paracoccus aminophilus JCM 7686 TaxID=1367847 RepID=S5YHZ7_PARAH|nr:Fe(3+)-hydroxamate ABC transporter permease FhuB [Paracoccus aminophilus]AGT11078.1 ABC cobalamin/Fe3+-siderophore transporter, inner membrane subunit [Paracoccus aminophilus JCM 7686]
MTFRRHLPLILLCLTLAALALAFAARTAALNLPPQEWLKALSQPDPTRMGELVFHYSLVPRLLLALLVGAALSLAGVLVQLVLRNPAAEPATLGTSAGAFLAVSAATIWAPGLLIGGKMLVALAGSAIAGALVLALSWRARLAPQVVLLAGLVVSLYAGAINTFMIMLHGGLIKLFIWGSGSLATQDWSTFNLLALQLLPVVLPCLILARPIAILSLSDELATGLGANPWLVRGAAIAVALWIAAATVAAVGVIGFIGLAAPEILRRMGYQRAEAQILLAPLLGALLLVVTDQIFLALPTPTTIPAGAATVLMGAPLLIWLIARNRIANRPPAPTLIARTEDEAAPTRRLIWLLMALGLLVLVALFTGKGIGGWSFGGLSTLHETFFWRGPRALAAASGAVMTAIAGGIIQRLTSNPLASPELLGISSGAACGAIVAAFVPSLGFLGGLGASMAGAGLVLAWLMALAWRTSFRPHDLFMLGIAITTAFSALVSLLLASGDNRVFGLLRWMNGATFLATPMQAGIIAATALIGLAALPLFRRWLAILPLGPVVARALGVPVARARGSLLLYASLLVALSVTVIGPLSFVGLMAPHLARLMGFRSPTAELTAAALSGAALMVVADWLGRVLMVPNQMPAGLLATLITAPLLAWLLLRRSST